MTEYLERETAVMRLMQDGCSAKNVQTIMALPAADVAPVRHGRWVPFHAEFAGDIQYCSVCEIGFAARTFYCPHCGAVMDGWRVEGEEND